MEEEERHPHLAKKDTKISSPSEEVSLLHNRHSRGKELAHKSESSVSVHAHHHTAQAKSNVTLTAAASTVPTVTNYNINVQFDPAIPQAGKPNHLSLIITEQKLGEPIKDFDIIHDKLMHLIIVNREDLSHFVHIHPKLDRKTGIFHIAHTFAKAGKYKMWMMPSPKMEGNKS